MDRKLFFGAISKFLLGVIITGLLIFLSAGTVKFLNGWIFMAILFVPMFVVGVVLMFKNPQLLKERLSAKEEEKEQGFLMKLSGIMFIAGFVISGLNYRFEWFLMPQWVTGLGAVIFAISYIIYGEVLRENTYLSRTVKVQENQKVIDTGLYGIVRHPMYFSVVFLFLSIPLILGSLYSFLIFLFYPIILAQRIKNEEKVLTENLDGYKEYKKKVKYRLIPFIW